MPATDVRAVMRGLHGYDPVAVIGLDDSRKVRELHPELRSFADGVISDGKFTNVSNEAMCYRLLDLELVKDSAVLVQGRLF